MELLDHYILKSAEYEGNKFEGDAGYFLRYFEMRRNQLMVIRNLHGELRRMKEMPVQAQVIATYIAYMSEYVTELNVRMSVPCSYGSGGFPDHKEEIP